MKEKIEQGVLLEVVKPFVAIRRQDYAYSLFEQGEFKTKHRSIDEAWYVSGGSIIEIRHPFAWHFRTTCDTYAHAPEEVLRDSCIYFGKVNSKVRWENNKKLKQILDENLYTKVVPEKINTNDAV